MYDEAVQCDIFILTSISPL